MRQGSSILDLVAFSQSQPGLPDAFKAMTWMDDTLGLQVVGL
jgi:hypothetical protein